MNTLHSKLLRTFLVLFHCVFLSTYSHMLWAAGVPGLKLEEIKVIGSLENQALLGDAQSASVGTVSRQQLQYRPLSRSAELLEAVPGMVVTQHSGEGKANQYFLRGFNLDHGTDFANYVDGIPVNMVTHGHGQGYTDINFLIPELVNQITYQKGPYYAQAGDFASAGSAHIDYQKDLKHTRLKLTTGRWGFNRLLASGSHSISEEMDLLLALEGVRYDGPWDTHQELTKNNGVIKLSHDKGTSGYSVTGMVYENQWNSTDQIPQRLVSSKDLGRYGDLDPLTGGDTHRYSLSTNLWGELAQGDYQATVYIVDYGLSLTTNASYYLDSELSDRFTQHDERYTGGGSFGWQYDINDSQRLELGATLRFDDISNVGFERADGSLRDFATVEEVSSAVFANINHHWSESFTSVLGLRYDYFDLDVAGENSVSNPDSSVDGDASKGLLSPKLSLRFGPWLKTEYFINAGQGYHSNDARGVVKPHSDIDVLVTSKGFELGFRSAAIKHVQLSAALFLLDLDSELVFVGDDGTTEARDSTRRTGVELGVYYQPVEWLIVDIDTAISRARFKDEQFDQGVALGRHVPDAMNRVFSVGATMDFSSGVSAGVRMRYFGPRDLNESGSVRSNKTCVINANLGYQINGNTRIGFEVFNVFDSDDDDITYYYESLSLEERNQNVEPMLDKHSHPVEPRSIRATVEYLFD